MDKGDLAALDRAAQHVDDTNALTDFEMALVDLYRTGKLVLIGPDAVEALRSDLHMACELIQEAKGMADGPDGGSVTNHLDAAENWIDKVSAALAALGVK